MNDHTKPNQLCCKAEEEQYGPYLADLIDNACLVVTRDKTGRAETIYLVKEDDLENAEANAAAMSGFDERPVASFKIGPILRAFGRTRTPGLRIPACDPLSF